MSEATEQLVQGSEEWHAARRGKLTASRFSDVLTKPKLKVDKEAGNLSEKAKSYMLDLVVELLTGESQGPPETEAMRWGTANEPEARCVYGELIGEEVREVGFVTHATLPEVGGSPDGLVGDDGGVEIKCPFKTRIHFGYMIDGVLPKVYADQVNGCMFITGRQWWDFVSYDPRFDWPQYMFRVRTYRDETEMTRLHNAVVNFRDRLLETLCTIRERTSA